MAENSERSQEAATVWDFSKLTVIGLNTTPGPGSIPASALAPGVAASNLGFGGVTQALLGAGVALANLGTRNIGANQLAQAQFLTQIGWFSVEDAGAIPNGVFNCTATINAAAASARAVGGTLYFPGSTGTTYVYDGNLNCNGLGGIVMNPGTILQASAAGAAAGVHGVAFNGSVNFSHSRFELGSIIGFGGAGVYIFANEVVLNVVSIENCRDGIWFDATNGMVLDNTVKFSTISNTGAYALGTSGLRYTQTAAANLCQGNIVNGNFIANLQYGIKHDSGGGGLFLADRSGDEIRIAAIDAFGGANSVGIWGDANYGLANMTIRIPGFFGGFKGVNNAGTGSFVYLLAAGSGYLIEADFTAGTGIAAYDSIGYSGLGCVVRFSRAGNRFQNSRISAIAANTTNNNRAGFNSGNPIFQRTIPLIFTPAAGQAANTFIDFAVFSPFANGASENFRFQMTNERSTAAIPTICHDCTSYPAIAGMNSGGAVLYQIIIRFYLAAAVATTDYWFGTLYCGEG